MPRDPRQCLFGLTDTAEGLCSSPVAVKLVVAHLYTWLRGIGDTRNNALTGCRIRPSCASDLVKAMMPPLDGRVVRAVCGAGQRAARAHVDDGAAADFLIAPPPLGQHTNVPVRLTRDTRSHSDSSMSSARSRGKIPALLTRPSGRPIVSQRHRRKLRSVLRRRHQRLLLVR